MLVQKLMIAPLLVDSSQWTRDSKLWWYPSTSMPSRRGMDIGLGRNLLEKAPFYHLPYSMLASSQEVLGTKLTVVLLQITILLKGTDIF